MAERIRTWLSNRRVSLALRLLREHVGKVEDAVVQLDKAIRRASAGHREEAFRLVERVRMFEGEADGMRRKLIEELARGELDARDREDLAHLTRRTDIIADWANRAAWNLRSFLDINLEIHPGLWNLFTAIGERLVTQVRALRDSMIKLASDPVAALESELDVERYEREVDDLYSQAKMAIYKHARNLDPPSFMFLRDFLRDLEQVADFCEDAGDLVRSVAIRRKAR